MRSSSPGRRGRRLARVALIAFTLLALVLVALRLAPHEPLQARAGYSRAFYSSDGALLRLTLAPDEQYRVWVPLARIDPRLVEAVQLYEDRWFRWHPGVNPASLVRGAWVSWRGEARRGGSTLTMQLARRLYRIDSRSGRGKLRQIAAALWLEARYGKREILEAYLNLAPYGSNIEGIEAASLVYFGKRANDLLLPQALALAVIPQNPNRRGSEARGAVGESAVESPGEAAWPSALRTARARLWAAWIARHPQDASAANRAALSLPLNLRTTRQLPFAAPHAVQTLLQAMGRSLPDTPEIALSLHAPTQAAVERAIHQTIAARRGVGIRNAAALLVDTSTMQVRAWVGSANFADAAIDGQVNATTAKRSPGSTLKPFIYGLGLDQGLLHPRTILKDAPTAFGTYNPENFDGRFEGPISARDALVRSRNVPAVAVASRLQPSLYGFLKDAGVRELASEQHYGLALALGGGELSMEELATLYAMLANGGELKPLAFAAGSAPARSGRRLLSPEAAFITLDMLRTNPRPDTGRPAFPRVAWKTGTSWGFRDAWTAGVFGRMVLIVWVGNFDGSSNPALVGVQVAAPLFFDIVDSLRSQGLDPGELARAAPANLAQVPVCAASGELPNDECKDLATTWFIPGRSPIKVSTLHRALWIDDASERAVCGAGPHRHREVFEFWPSDMLQVFAQAGMPRRVPPRPPNCDGPGTGATDRDGDGPQIVSPLRGAVYVLRLKSAPALSLRANAGRAGTVYWFANSAFVGSAAAGKDLVWVPPAAGKYTLSAVDAQGVADTREVSVEFAP